MKYILLSMMLFVALPIMAQGEDCQVQIFLSEYSNVKQSMQYDTYATYDDGFGGYDFTGNRPYSPTRHDGRNQIHAKFTEYLNSHGFATVDGNTRMGIHLKYDDSPTTLELEISLYDTKTHLDVYTVKIDTVYKGDKLKNIVRDVSFDFPNSVPHFEEVIDSIRKMAFEVYESTTDSWIEAANQFVVRKPMKTVFQLSQYPTCCPSYPKVRSRILTVFRDYVHNDHKELLKEAKTAWNSCLTETDARFVVALLNSEKLNDKNRKKADKILAQVSGYYPSLDINAHEDYTVVPELAAVAVQLAIKISKESN